MKGGKLDPIAVVKGGKSIPFADFMKASDSSAGASAAAAPASAMAPADGKKAEPAKK
jgi:hypothetical protein